MIPQQTLENYPVFGDNATKVQPDSAKMAAGFQQADVLPAEWMNWAWNKNSKGIREINQGLTSIEAELNNVVTAGGLTPAEETNNQILTAINGLIAAAETRAKLAAHPVGSLYWTSSTENPAVTFGGGTWTQIKDKFILAAGDTYANGATGGAATVTLTTAQMPSHSHTFTGNAATTNSISTTVTSAIRENDKKSHNHLGGTKIIWDAPDGQYGSATQSNVNNPLARYGGSAIYKLDYTSSTGIDHTHDFNHTHTVTVTGTNSSAGSGNAHENMPPYIVKYCWERTA